MDTILPALLALTAAALWGYNNHVQRKGLDDTDPLTGAFTSVATTAVLCWIIAPFLIDFAWFHTRAALILAGVGVIFPAIGQRLQIASVGLVGPALTASLGAFTPLFAVVIAAVLVGERPNLQAGVGLALMIAGLMLATHNPKGQTRHFPLFAVALPLGAALVRGIAQPSMKLALTELPSPFFALLVTSSVSTITLGLMLLRHHAKRRTRRGIGVRWFMWNGVVNGTGILTLAAALSLGSVTLVSPLAATIPLWALALGAWVFKRETLTRKHLIVALMVVIGGALILTR